METGTTVTHDDIITCFQSIWDRRTPEELKTLAQIKRFLEWLTGDPDFRAALAANVDDPNKVAAEYGIDIDLNLILPTYHRGYFKYRRTPEVVNYPLTKMWDDYMADFKEHRNYLRDHGEAGARNPRFSAWRKRQIARADSELGGSGPSISHPIAAFELARGCSVGCWFCGISADRFAGYQPYDAETEVLWRGVIGVMADRFGTAAQSGFCYWATDPSDNPDYPKYIDAFREITGYLPQTTTAAPLKRVEMTREVLELFNKHRNIVNRFSIINLKSLREVLRTFTADELFGVELVQQHKEAMQTNKARAGRALDRIDKQRAAGKDVEFNPSLVDHSTIACVSGFLVNLMDRSVKLVAPTRAGDRWRTGYRVYEERHFNTAEEFAAAIDGMIERYMPMSLAAEDRVAFRPDLTYDGDVEGGFSLTTNVHGFTMKGYAFAKRLGEMVARGDMTAGQISDVLVRDGHDMFSVANALQELFDYGVLDDDPKYGGIRRLDEIQLAS